MHLYSALCVLLYTQSALQSCGGVSPQPPPLMTFPRAQVCHAGPVHLDLQASVTPGVRLNLQLALKGPHTKQALLKHWGHGGHKAQHSLKRFERARGSCRKGGCEPLYGQSTLWRDRSTHLDLVEKCSQERYPLALLTRLTLSPRHSKWLRRRDLCDNNSTSDWARTSQ